MLRKLIALVLCLTLLTGLIPAASATGEDGEASLLLPVFEDESGFSFTAREVPYVTGEGKESTITLYFDNRASDLPFMDMDTVAEVMTEANVSAFCDYSLTLEKDSGFCTLTRENGSFLLIDYAEGEWLFSDYNLFVAPPNAVNGLDVIWTQKNAADELPYLIKHIQRVSRDGEIVSLYTGKYCIPTPVVGEMGYIPVQTVSDILVSPLGDNLFYNGECLFRTSSSKLEEELSERYNAPGPREKSMAFRQFTYNELCLALDFTYGLMEEHEIDNFDSLFIRTGLAEQFYSLSAKDTFDGLRTLTLEVFNDGHSAAFLAPWADENADPENMDGDAMLVMMESFMDMMRYDSARRPFYPDGPVGYEEVGDTAYITFDGFLMDDEVDYYSAEISNTVEDTVILLMYANEQLHREDCPIKNVVIDLSNNGGGAADSAMCVIAWFLGIANFSLQDTHDLAEATNVYLFDADRDREFDIDKDSVRHLRLFCIISPNSFSCGNLVPAAFKKSGTVTLLGRGSGGGACVVHNLSTADGCGFCVSGRLRVNTMKNGAYISVDEGIAPDVYITDISNIYDRAKLTDFIDNLF